MTHADRILEHLKLERERLEGLAGNHEANAEQAEDRNAARFHDGATMAYKDAVRTIESIEQFAEEER